VEDDIETQPSRAHKARPLTIHDLERAIKRTIALPLLAPVLLFGGWALGKAAARSLALPENTPVRTESFLAQVELEAFGRLMERIGRTGELTEDYVIMYRDHVAPVEETLRRRGVPDDVARQVAWPLVQHSYRQRLDPAMVTAVMLIESRAQPRATSEVGARGLMQVMPTWIGRWRGCGRDLYAVEDNLCYGTNILAFYLRDARGDESRALLGYNGCVNGTNTPTCFSYPDKIQTLRRQIHHEWENARGVAPAAAAP
jgi:hypothetical protein